MNETNQECQNEQEVLNEAEIEVEDNADQVTEEVDKTSKEAESEAKVAQMKDQLLRTMAEFDNYRKRTIKEKADLIKNAGERIICDFLPIIDNFERALTSMKTAEDVDAVRQGVELIYNQVMSMMKANGVAVIETKDAPFDTEYHEAITTIPAPTPELKDKIVDCTTKGYTMNEKVIRHAKVVVGA